MPERVGIVGVPPLAVIARLNREGAAIVDLDEPQNGASLDRAAAWLPRVFCAILRTAALNAMTLPLDRVVIDVGPGKCDGAVHLARVLEDRLAVPVERVENRDAEPFGVPLCETAMPLVEKMARITRSVQSAAPHEPLPACVPLCGFWGVPPRDFGVLEAFPPETHVFGWARCMENKTPADLALEERMDTSIPMVFFSQSFCAKSALAQHLGGRHPRSLVIDCDARPSASARAKIEAFLALSGVPTV